jgi:hypothetical protein
MTDENPPPVTGEGRVLAAGAFASIALAGATMQWTGQAAALGRAGDCVLSLGGRREART